MKLSDPALVSVVIPHRGDDHCLHKCLEGLRVQTYPADQTEIIIILNESLNRSLAFPLLPSEKLIWDPHYFSYRARNTGIQMANGSIIALTDSDTIPNNRWLEEAVAAMNLGVDIVAGAIELSFSRKPLTPSSSYEKLYAFDQEKNSRFGRSATANLVAQRTVFDRYGLFDASAQSGEDFAWTTRATQQGATLAYGPHAVVSHPARETLSELLRKAHRVTSHHSATLVGLERIRQGFRHYVSLYLAPPSRSRRKQCSPRELVLAYGMGIVVQLAKLWFFALGLGKRTQDHT